ncbi:UNVERIFIED_CONTAM: hypothetical protein GTU68_028760 [Idotea baltica]|nr:hypothetical protein [Idotea baltica]
MAEDTSISLNKYISATGYCSRREADRLLEQGRVMLNGEIARKGNRVVEGDEVIVDGSYIKSNPKKVFIAYNKPVGIVCTTDLSEKKNIINQIKHKQRLFPIGRLDKPSQGLIFLTNDGDIVNKILRAGNNHDKEYIVSVNKPITPAFIRKMGAGIPILGTVTKKCQVEQINENTFRIVLTQGLNRQIRRMAEFLDYKVSKLKRTRIMNVSLGNMEIGAWRNLTEKELSQLIELSNSSSKTEEASRDKRKKKRKY